MSFYLHLGFKGEKGICLYVCDLFYIQERTLSLRLLSSTIGHFTQFEQSF